MSAIYYYSIAFFIVGLIIQQLFYINKRYNQQNIRIIDYYLHLKLIDRIITHLNSDAKNSQKEKIQNLIKKYYHLDEIFVYHIDENKFELENYEITNLNLINKKIIQLKALLFGLKFGQLYKIDEINNIFGIYYREKRIIIFLIKNITLKTASFEFNPIESNLLESIILPLLVIKDK
jgi:hypothetical protein